MYSGGSILHASARAVLAQSTVSGMRHEHCRLTGTNKGCYANGGCQTDRVNAVAADGIHMERCVGTNTLDYGQNRRGSGAGLSNQFSTCNRATRLNSSTLSVDIVSLGGTRGDHQVAATDGRPGLRQLQSDRRVRSLGAGVQRQDGR